MNSSAPSRYGLFIVAAIVLALAFGLWNGRTQQAAVRQAAMQERQQTQHAIALLIRAFVADNQLKYSAISETSATYGDHKMETEARITRAPESMAIVYLKGDREGLHSGFNQKWHWRQSKPGAPMQAYAAVQQDAAALVARRFALMLDNYHVNHLRDETIAGRPAEIVEIRPLNPVDGAKGPGKLLGIDKETGLTLLTQTYNYQWRPVMHSKLREIDFSPEITPTTFASPEEMMTAAKKSPWMAQDMGADHADVARTTGVEPPQPAKDVLPKGFEFESVGIHRCQDTTYSPTFAALTRYTDGMNTLTVFAMRTEDAQREEKIHGGTGSTQRPSGDQSCDFGSGSLVMRDTKTGRLIAVGDLPPATLRRVLDKTNIQLSSSR
jgi:negative regulator of sigma E activity